MKGRHVDRDWRDGDLAKIRGCKLRGWLHFSNEYHDPTDQHPYPYPLSFLSHAHFRNMPDHDDENVPLASSKKFSSIRFRRLSISSKRRSQLKAAISGPHPFDGGGVPAAVLDDAPLRTLNGTQLLHTNSVSTALNGPSPTQHTLTRGLRRNSDIPLRQHNSNLAWPTNHPEISPAHGSPHHSHRTASKKPRKADISRPLVPDSSRIFPTSGVSPKRSRRSAQINRGSRFSGIIPSGVLKGISAEATSQKLLPSDNRLRGPNLLDTPSDEFDPRTMIDAFPALDLDLNTSAASFGSVKQRTGKIDKALRTSRTTLLLASQEKAEPDLAFTDDSDAFSSPPSTPSTPAWENTVAHSTPKANPKLANELELADVHAQIQAMIDSSNRPSSTASGDYMVRDREHSSVHRNHIPPSLRPSNPMYRSFPRLVSTHRRSASSPPLGSGIHYAYPPDFGDRLFYRPITPVIRTDLPSPTFPPSKTTPMSPTSSTPTDPIIPATPTKKSSSERSDSPSVYSQQSPSSQINNITPTSSNASSPDQPYVRSKHERLLAAISEGITSPTKPGPTAPSILGPGHRKNEKTDLALSPLRANPAVPVIVVTDPNDDDLVYSESSFSIVDMYAGSNESVETGQRRRTRTANPVSHITLHLLTAR